MKIFISYSDKDRNKMIALEKAIISSSLGLKPIIVAKDITPGLTLTEKVKRAINDCDILIPIITKNSIISQWVNQEIGFAEGKERKIFPIVDKGIIKKLKGFVHNQIDIPFSFESNIKSKNKEGISFRKSYLNLLDYISSFYAPTLESKPILIAEITPNRLAQGDNYTTTVQFKGIVKNGFFDNLIRHQGSTWKKWNWDKDTLQNSSPTTGGLLNGYIDINKSYCHSTQGWPLGKHTIYVRIYNHPVVGEKTRYVVSEVIKEIEII